MVKIDKTSKIKADRASRRLDRMNRIKGFNLVHLIPNMITIAACCAALTAVRLALEGRLEFAVAALLLAAILDGLDGRMARLLNVTSDFGAQMDSLSDLVSFGVAPSLIIYYWILHDMGGAFGGLGWGTALFYIICCALRLARFNSRLTTMPAYAYNFFQGVPSPAGAGLMLMPLILTFAYKDLFADQTLELPAYAVAIWTIAVGLLMISELPTFGFKKMRIPANRILPVMAVIALGFAGISGRPWLSLMVILSLYIISFPLSYLSFRKLRDAALGNENKESENAKPLRDEAKE